MRQFSRGWYHACRSSTARRPSFPPLAESALVSQEKSDAIVLRGVDFSETSRIVTLLTPQRGKLAVIAKGARRRNSPLAPVLDTFNLVEVVYLWKDGREVQTLAEATLMQGWPGLKRDLERSAYAAFCLEMAGKVAHENESSDALYARLLRGLREMETGSSGARAVAAWTAFQLLAEAGYALETAQYPGALAEDLQRLAGDAPPPETNSETFNLLRRYASHHLESDFKSARVIDQLFT